MEKIAEGVWVIRGDARRSMTIYFLEDSDGVVQFEAGSAKMAADAKRAAAELGGLKRVVLGHAHADHRGTAPAMGAPVFCHPDAVEEAESPESIPPYFELEKIPVAPLRWIYPSLLRKWDGGPVKIEGTVSEGDRVAGFEVVELPGHAPGQIALWRESDRLALCTDVVYMIDSVGEKVNSLGKRLPPGEATVPHPLFNQDHARARESVHRLAEMEPATLCPGHAGPLRGDDLRATLDRAAEKL
jgi:hydroxyacylglutathione hydrolase